LTGKNSSRGSRDKKKRERKGTLKEQAKRGKKPACSPGKGKGKRKNNIRGTEGKDVKKRSPQQLTLKR